LKRIVIIENTFYTVLSLRMEIIQYLQSKSLEVYVLSTGDAQDKQELESYQVKVFDIGKLVSNPFSLLGFLYRIYKNLKEFKPEIVYTFTIRPNIFGSLVAGWMQIPTVSNITGIGPLFENQSFVYRIARGFYHFAMKKNQCIFFQNAMDMNLFLNHNYCLPQQAKLLPGSGVDVEKFAPIAVKKTSNDFVFLMISRLIKDKGVLEYVEAARKVKQKFPQAQFQLLGPFWTQNLKSNTITEENVQGWVDEQIIDYLGYTYDVRPFIAASDCIVLPSYREGNANVLMQGASMEKPLLASDVVGCNNLVVDGETGFLFVVKNVDDLADKMEKMLQLSNAERQTMGQKGRAFMKQHYNKTVVLEAYEAELSV
jgi:glycosyltransferase involved in cell wall biosynthesis